MKITKKIQLEVTTAGHPRIIEFELPAYIQTKEVDAYLKGVTDLLRTLEANAQPRLLDNVLQVIDQQGILVEDK